MVDENPLPRKKAVVVGFTSILLIITGIICAVYGVNYHKDVYSSTDHVLYKTFSKKVNIHTNKTITSTLTYTAKAPKILWLCFLTIVAGISTLFVLYKHSRTMVLVTVLTAICLLAAVSSTAGAAMSFNVKSKFYPIRDAWRENKCFAAGNTTTIFLCRCIISQIKMSDSIMEINESQMVYGCDKIEKLHGEVTSLLIVFCVSVLMDLILVILFWPVLCGRIQKSRRLETPLLDPTSM
ncbi:uncharacterized protein LOC130656915 [Hydractinia symbiolongicarpus]|uniref:uncharacterized protein LOC130656915 n=1 Tax=Hydractinia symbiolongicarpus TaxID=13093 RepID=UPI00254D202F|nr:uncharacterized protein LOC130656915 [Hydractinia symbiolongicarpus]